MVQLKTNNSRSSVWILLLLIFYSQSSTYAQSPPQSDPCGRTFLNFDGSNDYLDVEGTTIDGNAGTWEAWVRKDNWATQSNGVLFGNDIAFNTTNSMYLSFHAAVGLHFRYGDTSSEPITGGAIYGQFTNGFTAESWHHIAVSWEHISGTTTLKMFVDGVEQTGFTAGSRQTHNALIDPGVSLNFGFSQGENYLEAGSLAEIRTWNVVRTETEIANNMNSILTGSETGLTGYWPVNDLTGSTSAANLVSGAPVTTLTNFDETIAWELVSDVQMSVNQEGAVIQSTGSFDFGISESGNSFTKTFTISNERIIVLNLTGNPLVNLSGIDASEFSIDLSGTSSTLNSAGTTTFDLTFSPGNVGSKSANISISTDDTCLPLYEMNISGESSITTKPDNIIISNTNPCLNEEISLTVDGGLIFGDSEWVWYEGDVTGTAIGIGESITLTPQKSARYLVRAENAGNPLTGATVSSTVNLKESSLIQIDEQPRNGIILLGNTHTISIKASGSQLSYQWQKDGLDLIDDGNIAGSQTANLNFTAITAGDAGTYTCIISNSCNSVTSESSTLVTTSDSYATLPLLEDFESTDGSFISSNLKGPTTWEYGTPAGGANSGTGAWETDLDGILQNNEINILTSPTYLLSPELIGAELSFQLNYDLTLFQQSGTPVTDRWFQGAELNISTDDGTSWQKVTDFEQSGYNRSSGFIFNDANLDWPLWTDNSGGWVTVRVNLSDYVGQSVLFRIIVSTTSGFAGWYFGTGAKVDDWSLEEVDNSPPTASIVATQGTVNNTALELQMSFSKEVSMTLTNLSVLNGSLSNLQTVDNQTYTFDVTPMSSGFVTVNINESVAAIEDLAGNTLANSPTLTFLNDTSVPEVFLYAEEGPVFSDFTADIVFSKPVSNFDLVDLTASNANLSNLQTTDNVNFTVDVAPISSGTITIDVPAMVAQDQFGNMNNVSNSFSIEFNPEVAPVLDPVGDKTVDENLELAFTVNATDLNVGQMITYTLDATSLSKGMTLDATSGAFSWTSSESQDGDHTVTITATDNSAGALSDSEIITITVNEINQDPVVSVGPSSWTFPEDAYVSRSYNITDPDGQEVTVSLDANAQSLGFGILDVNNPVVNKLIFWTATLEVSVTTFDVTVTVTDGVGGSTDFVITMNVEEVNQLPTLSAIGDQSVDELSELAFTVAGSDADVPVQSLTYSISDGLLAGMSIDDQTGSFSWTPTEAQSGSHLVTFEITDDFSPTTGTNIEVITITVNEVNAAPVLDAIGDQTIDERSELTFTASATDVDLPANNLVFSVDATSLGKGMSIDGSTGAFSWTPTEAHDGDHTVIITVTDDGTGSLVDDETITITVNELPNTWDGNSWSDGINPTGEDAHIAGDYDFSIDGSFESNDLEVSASFTLTVDDESTLTVNGHLTNDGTIHVTSGSSLVTLGLVSGNGYQIDRITTFDTNTGRYSIVGSPVQSESFDALGTNALIYGYDQSEVYNPEGNAGLGRFKTPIELSQTSMIVGEGYFSAFTGDTNGLVSFSGTPNTGTINVTLDYTDHPTSGTTPEEDDFEGFNLVSNPYPSAIDFSIFMSENSGTDINGSIYLWDDHNSNTSRGDNADYVIVNAMGNTDSRSAGLSKWDGNIRSTQGFFVKANSATSLTFNNTMRVTGNNADGGFYRTVPTSNSIKLVLSNEESKRATVIGFANDATPEIDKNYDAASLSGGTLQLYSLQAEGTKRLGIQGLPNQYKEEIRLGFKTTKQGTYTISISNLNELQDMGQVLLKDHLIGKSVNLKEEAYSFTSLETQDESRFTVQANRSVISSIEELEAKQPFYTYTSQGILNVVFEVQEQESINLEMIDLTGKAMKIKSSKVASNKWQINTQHLPNSIYILVIQTEDHIWKTKVITK